MAALLSPQDPSFPFLPEEFYFDPCDINICIQALRLFLFYAIYVVPSSHS